MVATQSHGLASEKTSAISSTTFDYHAWKSCACIKGIESQIAPAITKADWRRKKNHRGRNLCVRLRLEQSVASQHLAILRKAGIVSTQRDGKFIYYSVNFKRLEEIDTFFVKQLVG